MANRPGPLSTSRRFLSPVSIVLLALLALPLVARESESVATLRGEGRIEAELQQAQAHGYYEALLDSASGPSEGQDGNPAGEEQADDTPPPGWVNFASSGIVEPVPTYLRWRMKPDLDLLWNGKTFHTNHLGYRTPEFSIPKPPDVYRIVVLGSSNTLGHGVHDHEVYVRLLENWLKEAAASPDRRIEVVNLAISGDSPTQQLLRFQREVEPLEPDWILCDATVLDFSLEEIHLEWVVREGVMIPFSFVRRALRSAGVSAEDPPEQFRHKLRGVFEALLEGSYAGRSAEARRLGVPLTLVLLPRADRKAHSPRLLRLIHRLASRNGIPCLDVSGAFDNMEPAEFRVSPWDKHPSALGHRAIVLALRRELVRQGGGPDLPLRSNIARQTRPRR